MSTQLQSKVRRALLTTVTLLGMVLPLGSLLLGNAAMAHSMPNQDDSHHHHHHKTTTQPPTTQSPPTTEPKSPTTATYMESYNFNYQYANQPIINGGATPESYLGSGFAPAGTYKSGQTITITDSFGRPAGTYTIGSVNDQTPYDSQKLNTVTVSEYDYDLAMAPLVTKLFTGNGLVANTGSGGLGSESGTLTATGMSFNNQQLGEVPMHF